MDAVVQCIKVSKLYERRFRALCDVNLEIKKGEFVFIVGPTGAGKTTLLRHIYMAEFPDEGEVRVLNFSSRHVTRKEINFLRRKIGVIFQDFKLLPDRNALSNVSLALEAIGESSKKAREKALNVLYNLGMLSKAEKSIHELSGGEKQKLAIARALVREPVILIADEPTGNIDPSAQEEIMYYLQEIHSKGTTILMATHNYSLIERIKVKRVIHMEFGKIKREEK
ncbi:MAG: ATP-binding cassette domain-containing protein [Candidatus Hydrothermales bacterium]